MSAGLLGTGDEQPYIKIRHRGTDYFFPLSHDPENRYLGGGDIQTSTLESFSPSTVAGDPSLVSNELLAVLLWSNFQGGMGTVKYQEQEGTGSLDSFYYATMDTRFQGMALLPPKRLPLFTLPYNRTDVRFLVTTRDNTYRLVVWDIGNPGVNANIGVIEFNTTTGAYIATNNAGFASATTPTAIREVILFNSTYVAMTNTGIFYMTSVGAWQGNWQLTGGMYGAVVHDNKLYTIAPLAGTNDYYLYWTIDPTFNPYGSTTPWPNRSPEPLRLNWIGDETVIKLVEWKNRQDTRSLFVLTNKRIVAWDDDGYWVEFMAAGVVAGTNADMSVWPQDKALYFAPADSGANVLQFQNQTISNISPNKKGGLGSALVRTVRRIQGGLNFLFGQGGAAVNAAILGGGTYTAPPAYGQIMAYNGQGWHTLVEGSVSDTITGMAWGRDQVFFVRNGLNVEAIYAPDAPQAPLYINGPVAYAEGTFYIESADADAGLENIYKTARYSEIVFQGGMPVNHGATFELSFDNGTTWATQGTITGPNTTGLWRFPITIPGVTDARGVPFITVRWRINVTKNVGASATVTPVLRSVALYYLRANDLIDGIQFQIDLTPDRIKRMMTILGLGDSYDGKTPRKLRAILQEIKRSKYNPEITYGPPGNRVVIPAAEIRISQQENARTALGKYTLTARDVSTQTTTVS